jgi:hypothetical protein
VRVEAPPASIAVVLEEEDRRHVAVALVRQGSRAEAGSLAITPTRSNDGSPCGRNSGRRNTR